jgi:hypothetical protein
MFIVWSCLPLLVNAPKVLSVVIIMAIAQITGLPIFVTIPERPTTLILFGTALLVVAKEAVKPSSKNQMSSRYADCTPMDLHKDLSQGCTISTKAQSKQSSEEKYGLTFQAVPAFHQ